MLISNTNTCAKTVPLQRFVCVKTIFYVVFHRIFNEHYFWKWFLINVSHKPPVPYRIFIFFASLFLIDVFDSKTIFYFCKNAIFFCAKTILKYKNLLYLFLVNARANHPALGLCRQGHAKKVKTSASHRKGSISRKKPSHSLTSEFSIISWIGVLISKLGYISVVVAIQSG